MYSNLPQILSRHELESLTDSLEIAVSTHLDWLRKVNHSLVCRLKSLEQYCSSTEPYKKSQFGQWYYRVTNSHLLVDDDFIEIGELHKKMHLIVSELMAQNNEQQAVSESSYLDFMSQQELFWDKLQYFTKKATESLGNIDFLTALPNRRAFNDMLLKELSQVKRLKTGSTLILADIDSRHVNDTYGHQSGDIILVEIAKIFQKSIRDFDMVARYGGEEFIFCIANTSLDVALGIIERIRITIANESFDIAEDEPLSITCSFGLCYFNADISAKDIISHADVALYEAKQSGRNCSKTYKT